MTRTLLGALLPLAVIAAPASPAETLRVTLDEAVALLRRQNPEVLSAALRVRAAGGDLAASRRFPNPVLSVGAGNFPVGRTNPPGLGVGDTAIEQVGVAEELVLWGKRGAKIAAAGGKQAAAAETRADVERELAFEVRARFAALLVTSERLRLAEQNLDRYRELVRVSGARAKAGEIPGAEFDKISLEQRTFERERDDADVERRRTVAELLPLLGADAADVVPVGDLRLPDAPTDAERLAADALGRRPDVRAAEREVEAADAALRLAQAERWPNVTVGVQYTHDQFTISGDLPNSIAGNVSLPIPVLDQNQGQITRAESEAMIARHDLKKLRLSVPQEVRAAVHEYEVARGRVDRFEHGFLREADDARHAAEVAYREGAITLLEFLEAERTWIDAHRDHLDALKDGFTAAFDVERAAALETP